MTIERLIECIDLPAADARRYLIAELDEFVQSEDLSGQQEEFGDILFALLCMTWAHTRQHFRLHADAFEAKIRNRLRAYGTVSKARPNYRDNRIPEMSFGVVHLAFSKFGGQWQSFDALQNGTVAEIQLLTDAPFFEPGNLTNHCIITFGDTQCIEYDFLYSAQSVDGGNTIRCQIPDFIFKRAKRELKFNEFAAFMSNQVLAAIDGLQVPPGGIMHLHSWESGFVTESNEFQDRMGSCKTIFSPYLTTGRLRALVEDSGGPWWTMGIDELAVASTYERKLMASCMRVVLESSLDFEFYRRWVHSDRLEVRSFAREQLASVPTVAHSDGQLTFLAGGRPVREKGFLELCREFKSVSDWAVEQGLNVSLSILCREARPEKGASYIDELERVIAECQLNGIVTIEPKVSLDRLRQRIEASTAIIAPSIYDPFCLMPTYAVEAKRPAFISGRAGVSENVKSRQFIFDPEIKGDLLRAISAWHVKYPQFEYESRFPSYRDIYLSRETPKPWA